MAEYGCSRMTVNKALRSLVEAGVVKCLPHLPQANRLNVTRSVG